MKDFFDKVKMQFPIWKDKFLSSIGIILVYQAFLFLISPNFTNQILLVIIILIFAFQQMSKPKVSS